MDEQLIVCAPTRPTGACGLDFRTPTPFMNDMFPTKYQTSMCSYYNISNKSHKYGL